jgi:hypothetical protein
VHSQRAAQLATAYLKLALGHRKLDGQLWRLDSERPQEEDAAQRRSSRWCAGAHQLKVARSGEDDPTLHHMVGDESIQCSSGG